MAHFRGTTQGNRGQASRLGTKSSGMVTENNTWDSGVKVVAEHINGHDLFYIYSTGGSNHSKKEELLSVIDNGELTTKSSN